MGLTYANIRIENGGDAEDFRRGKIGDDEIRQIEINMLVDTGSINLAINQDMLDVLGLKIIGYKKSILADGTRRELPVAGSVVVRFLDRWSITSALVLPYGEEPLLGAIPLEDMDLYVHPARNELLPVHPEGPIMSLR